jgi:hypothetical protein
VFLAKISGGMVSAAALKQATAMKPVIKIRIKPVMFYPSFARAI